MHYYERTSVRPLDGNIPYYAWLLRLWAERVNITSPVTMAIGGIHPRYNSIETLYRLVGLGLRGIPVNLILIDQNASPLRLADNHPEIRTIQAPLQRLPPLSTPIDVLILDYTTEFMADRDICEMARTLPQHLSPHGLVLAALGDSLVPLRAIEQLVLTLKCHVPIYLRPPDRLIQLMNPLRPLYIADLPQSQILLALCSPESPWQTAGTQHTVLDVELDTSGFCK